ncbi:MAG: adenylyl-sulfate kinase [Dehalococcoidia bacterium]
MNNDPAAVASQVESRPSVETAARVGPSKGFVVWLTGLSGAGKSTLARSIEEPLLQAGMRVEVLDGDQVRQNLSRGLGFSREDRDINIRRIGYVARLLARNDVAVIVAAISPYREVRDEIRASVKDFVEVYVKCSVEELIRRDTKGLYEKALRGEIKNFTGVSDPYEPPIDPEVTVDTELESLDAGAARVITVLKQQGLLKK